MLIYLLNRADWTLIWTEATDLWITVVAADGKVGQSLVAIVLTPQSFYFIWLGGVGAVSGSTGQHSIEPNKAEPLSAATWYQIHMLSVAEKLMPL